MTPNRNAPNRNIPNRNVPNRNVPVKTHLNLGAGENKLLPPWSNHDRDMDITQPLPVPAHSIEEILIEHCLEHVSGPQAFRFLKEAFRVLKPGGLIRICVPELERLSRDAREDIIVNHGHLHIYDLKVLTQYLETAGFTSVTRTDRREIDGHWKVIGLEKDDLETLRVEAIKPETTTTSP